MWPQFKEEEEIIYSIVSYIVLFVYTVYICNFV